MIEGVRNRDLAFDTSVLVPFVRSASGTATEEQRRTGQAYSPAEMSSLRGIVREARSCKMLPYVLAETSNLVSQKAAKEVRRAALQALVADWLDAEVKSEDVVRSPDFTEFGAADAALLIWLRQGTERAAITEDAKLWAIAAYGGLPMINFSHYRDVSA